MVLVPVQQQTFTITVNSSSVAPASANASSLSVCNGSTITLTQTGGVLGSGSSWKWYDDAGMTNLVGTSTAADASLVVTVNTLAASKTYYVRAEGPCPAATADASVVVTVTQPPTVTAATAFSTICSHDENGAVGQIFLFSNNADNESSFLWTSTTGGTFTDISGSSATYTPSALDITNGTVTLTLTAYPISPCAIPAQSNVTITINPAATVNAGTDQTICSNQPAILTPTFDGGASSGSWSTAGDGSFNGNEYTLGANDITAGSVTLTYTSDDPAGPCGPVSDDVVIFINQAPAAPMIGGPLSVCPGQLNIPFTIQNINFDVNYTWSVFNNEGSSSF